MPMSKSERSFERMVKSVTDYAICMLDTEGCIISWNAGAERIKGYTAEEVHSRNFSMFFTEEDRAAGRPKRALEIATRTGRYENEGLRVRKDGSHVIASVVIEPVFDDAGHQVGFAKITRDVTERRNLERQLVQAQKMEAVGHLSGGMAHDFNNILSVVISNLDMLIHDLPDGNRKALASDALAAAEKGANVVRQLLAFSRNQALRPETFEVSEIICGTEPLLRSTLGEAVALELVCKEDVWPVLADPGQLESAIINLTINARDAMPDGGRLAITCSNSTLDYELARREDLPGGDYVVLTITDSGTGIERDVLDRIFEPFFTTKEVGKGSGLGLSMVYGFAKQTGGNIHITSEAGSGTEVRIYLPRALSSTHSSVEASPKGVTAESGGRILLVEDQDDVRKSVILLMNTLNYRVTGANDAEAALKLVDDGLEFDLLFTDVLTPGSVSGLELARELKKRRPDLPVIFSSGFSDPDVISTDLGPLGATLLPKPYRRVELSAVLDKALGRSDSSSPSTAGGR